MQNSMPITHTVRSATVRDAKAIARVHAAVIQALRRERQSPDRHGGPSLEEHQAYWREAIEYSEPQVKVVIEGDAMVGLLALIDRVTRARPRRPVKSGPCAFCRPIGGKG